MLERINNINDLKQLDIKDKKILAKDIREYLLEVVSKNGGHLASNLGVVELTIALESVFDVNKDKIIWDVGHQSYVHKILNGRKEELKSIRKIDGIAGFPKYQESETDCFNTGHSSTSISAAMGMACARDLKNEDNSVIAVIGDGSLTGGMALEALNHAGSSKKNIIVILNDNEMSISKNVGGINQLLTKLRVKKNYTRSNDRWKRKIKKIPVIGKHLVNMVSTLKKIIKQIIIPGMYFEEIGFKYVGPIDGHNIEDLEYIFKEVKKIDEPILIHVLTKKGKGYKPAEDNPDKFHGASPFNIETGKSIKKKSKDYSAAFGEKLVSMAAKNDKIVAITAAMKDGTGLTKFGEAFPDRLFDVGIAEQHALTFAAGLAKEGMVPFVSIYSSFYQRAYDQVIHDICMQNLPVIMCVDRAGIVGNDGETHQGLYDLSFFKLIPNIVIMAPRDFKELNAMMEYAVQLKCPVVIRYPRGSEEAIDIPCKELKLGKCEKVKTGKDITIVSIGKMVPKALEIANKLKEYKIDVEVINSRFLKPFDNYGVLKSIEKTKNVIVIEDGTCIGGLSSTVKELLVDNKMKDIKFKSYSYPDKFIEHGSVSELEDRYGFNNDEIVQYIRDSVK
ncbi:MAG: 1-deoxy-D-xylulose-5-phosphate synthase [Firmicutes bacterium]|nr:1-deoxy-D-xylulose-5-phosphate synthase [Bacillota bacterium]